MESTPSDLQLQTLRLYKALWDEREGWDGALVLCCGAQCALTEAPPAVSIAGGATLAVDVDTTAMKSAMRRGHLDFVVNTLDEALRTLKNEVRQKRPLSVGLSADLKNTLSELVERGVQPDRLLVPVAEGRGHVLELRDIQTLKAQGMRTQLPSTHDMQCSSLQNEYFFAAPDVAALRNIDEALLALLHEDSVRRRWIRSVPKYLRDARSGGRWIWLSEGERQVLTAQGISPQ